MLILVGCGGMNHHLQNLKSQSSKDRAEAIYWLCTHVQNQTNKKLLAEAIVKDKSDLVRSLAARLMALDGDPQFVPLLQKAMQDSSALVRMEAIQSLGSYLHHQSLPQITAVAAKESNAWVRLKILKDIDYMDAKDSLPFLIERLDDSDPSVRFHALLLLEKFSGQKMGTDKEVWNKWYTQQAPKDK